MFLKRAVIISLIVYSILITSGITLIFVSSERRDERYLTFFRNVGNAEKEILRVRAILDGIVLGEGITGTEALFKQLDSLKYQFSALHAMIDCPYVRHAPEDGFSVISDYDTLQIQLTELQRAIRDWDAGKAESERNLLYERLNEFNLKYKEYETHLLGLLVLENRNYRWQIIGIVTLGLLFLALAGFVIILLVNRLIRADRSLINKTVEVENRERERIAADLHDGLGSLLSGLLMHVQVLEKEFAGHSQLRKQLRNLNRLSNDAITSIEEVINNLNPSLLSRYGLVTSIRSIIGRVNQLGKTRFTIDDSGLDVQFQERTGVLLFRICTELINNALKHSHASNASFRFYNVKREFHLEYRDDGVGFVTDPVFMEDNKGGLYNLLRRVESMDGICQINSLPDRGVEIDIIVRVNTKPEKHLKPGMLWENR